MLLIVPGRFYNIRRSSQNSVVFHSKGDNGEKVQKYHIYYKRVKYLEFWIFCKHSDIKLIMNQIKGNTFFIQRAATEVAIKFMFDLKLIKMATKKLVDLNQNFETLENNKQMNSKQINNMTTKTFSVLHNLHQSK